MARFDANSNHGEFQFQGNQNITVVFAFLARQEVLSATVAPEKSRKSRRSKKIRYYELDLEPTIVSGKRNWMVPAFLIGLFVILNGLLGEGVVRNRRAQVAHNLSYAVEKIEELGGSVRLHESGDGVMVHRELESRRVRISNN